MIHSRTRAARLTALVLLFVLPCAVGGVSAQSRITLKPGKPGAHADSDDLAKLPPPPPLGKAATEAMKIRYLAATHWVQKTVILLSLNHFWHPVGSDMILEAVRNKDARLRAYGIEALLRCEDGLLPNVVTSELLDELISKQLNNKNRYYRKRLLAALPRIVPGAKANSRSDWAKYWRGAKDTWKPGPWKPKEQPKAGDKSRTVGAAERAFDLYSSGLDLTICIDSTGSMQPTIDALAAALGQMIDILRGVSPKFRLGLVHYKDKGELGKQGSKVIQPLTKGVKAARTKLLKLRAFGGADLPEAVLGGLEVALSRKMKWNRNANKVLILIGDAPPHDHENSKAIDLARAAYEKPGSQSNKPTTGPRQSQRPYITSAIGVFMKLGAAFKNRPGYDDFVSSQKIMRQSFKDIAAAGGGVFVSVEFEVRLGRPGKSKDKKRGKGGTDAVAASATQKIVEHILVLSFGKKFAREMRAFVRIFYAYKDARLFK